MTATVEVSELEELLEEEIPCGGVRHWAAPRPPCGRPAVLKHVGHHNKNRATSYKCLDCWQALVVALAGQLAEHGRIRCETCNGLFYSVESFIQYRPF